MRTVIKNKMFKHQAEQINAMLNENMKAKARLKRQAQCKKDNYIRS